MMAMPDAVRVRSVRTSRQKRLASSKALPQPIITISLLGTSPSEVSGLVAGHVAGAFGDQGVGTWQVQDIVRPGKRQPNGKAALVTWTVPVW